LIVAPIVACSPPDAGRATANGKDTVVVFVAASLANPVRAQLDSFAARTGTTIQMESGGSMDHVRKITELHRVPDLLLLADEKVFPDYLQPAHLSWWAEFARNRLAVAYTPRSAGHDSIDASNWFRILSRSGVEVGRGDPATAPVGTRTLVLFTLAELYYGQPGLAERLAENAPPRNVRPDAAQLAALLAAGELDYIYDYESVARANGFQYIVMPSQITGAPITYALSIPSRAPHPAAARRALEYLESSAGRAGLRASFVDMMDTPIIHGTGAPAFMTTTPP
jgi:molybdate/tungstate transport system substrate-binding protein